MIRCQDQSQDHQTATLFDPHPGNTKPINTTLRLSSSSVPTRTFFKDTLILLFLLGI